MESFFKSITLKLIDLLRQTSFGDETAVWVGGFLMLFLLILFSILGYYILWKLMRFFLVPIIQRSKTKLDDILLKHQFFRKVSYLFPIYTLYQFADEAVPDPAISDGILAFLEILLLVVVVLIINSVLSTFNDFYKRYEISRDHPMDVVFQVLKIIVIILAFFIAVGVILDGDIGSIFLSLGAFSAVLLLVFKDTILGLVGGLQLIFNKMIAIGDWITVPQFGADGDVEEITLISIKVKNFDQTIISVPTYSLISGSFQNWKGMKNAGGRRIKRAVHIDMESIRFCNEEMVKKFRQIELIKSYLSQKEHEVQAYNQSVDLNEGTPINGKRLTNVGIFREYLKSYLLNRGDIRDDLTFLVRQLEPNERGLPIEIYVFTNTTVWADYENIQSDIFDHILSIMPEFGLRVFQNPSSSSLANLGVIRD